MGSNLVWESNIECKYTKDESSSKESEEKY